MLSAKVKNTGKRKTFSSSCLYQQRVILFVSSTITGALSHWTAKGKQRHQTAPDRLDVAHSTTLLSSPLLLTAVQDEIVLAAPRTRCHDNRPATPPPANASTAALDDATDSKSSSSSESLHVALISLSFLVSLSVVDERLSTSAFLAADSLCGVFCFWFWFDFTFQFVSCCLIFFFKNVCLFEIGLLKRSTRETTQRNAINHISLYLIYSLFNSSR